MICVVIVHCAMPLGKFFSDTPLEDNEIDQGVTSRRSQTEKARNALATSRVSRRWARTVQKEIGIHHESSKSSEETKGAQALQKQFFTGRLHHTHALSHSYESITCPDQNKANQRGRARCTWSLLRAIAQAFEAVFASPQAPPVKFVINTVVPDDTNTRMKGPNQGDRSLVHTVMNVVQSCAVYCDGLLKQGANKNHDWQCFSIPCPLSVLKTANTDHIHAAYRSTLVACASGLGERWKAFSLKPEVSRAVANAKWAAQVMCGDALEANSSAFRCERTLLAHNRQRSVKVCNTVAIRFKCCNHQLGLVRKPVVLGIERYWSTLVRLAHLMECAGFRRRFTAALVSLLQKPGIFQRHLPKPKHSEFQHFFPCDSQLTTVQRQRFQVQLADLLHTTATTHNQKMVQVSDAFFVSIQLLSRGHSHDCLHSQPRFTPSSPQGTF